MADLTVLSSSSVPLYPLLNASRSSLFSNYVAGASSSTVNLTTTSSLEGRRTEPPPRLNIQQNIETETDVESEEAVEEEKKDQERSSPPVTEEEVESPRSFVAPGGWNRNDNSWRLDSTVAEASGSSSLAPTPRGRMRNQQHRPSRSRSAPPTQTTFIEPPSQPFTAAPDHTAFDIHRIRRYTSGSPYTSGTESGHSSPSSSFSNPPSYGSGYGKSKSGDLLRPPPPLHRPTTFWRRTPRSGVTASSYSPSSHLIRRSTFVAAGLSFDKPMADLSALGVESRIKAQFDEDNARAKVSEVFWEVVVQR